MHLYIREISWFERVKSKKVAREPSWIHFDLERRLVHIFAWQLFNLLIQLKYLDYIALIGFLWQFSL